MPRRGILLGLATMLVVMLAGTTWGQGYGDGPGGGPTSPGDSATPPGGGPDLRLQLRTAVAHAQNAAASEALRGAQSHLLHVVNCLEGPRGRDYAQAEINPCQGQGNGILVDLRSNPGRASWVPVAEAAKDLAMRGSKLGELASARASARGVAALLATVAENVR